MIIPEKEGCMQRVTTQDLDLGHLSPTRRGQRNTNPELTLLFPLLQPPTDASVDLSQSEARSKGAY